MVDISTQTEVVLLPLVNVTDCIEILPILTEDEEEDIKETIMHLLCDYIEDHALSYAEPSFHETLRTSVTSLMSATCSEAVDYTDRSLLEERINILCENAEKEVFAIVCPRRSYSRSFVRRPPNIHRISTNLERLRSIPQPKQRTEEWYKQRWGLMSASNAWKCFGTVSQRNSLIYEKAKPYIDQKFGSVSLNSPLHWGQKYEPVSVMIYEQLYTTEIEEFGCIPHRDYHFIGASPDGINCKTDCDRYGRMLEIKNIVNREIDGVPKFEYWIQMQLQMESCDLKECDFLETRFREYETCEEFNADGTFSTSAEGKRKGIVMQFWFEGGPVYKYAPIGISEQQFEIWENEQMTNCDSDTHWVRNIYWVLDEISCVLVLRNKLWFSEAVRVMADVWTEVIEARKNGFDNYAPLSAKNKQLTKQSATESASVLYIDTSNIQYDSE